MASPPWRRAPRSRRARHRGVAHHQPRAVEVEIHRQLAALKRSAASGAAGRATHEHEHRVLGRDLAGERALDLQAAGDLSGEAGGGAALPSLVASGAMPAFARAC